MNDKHETGIVHFREETRRLIITIVVVTGLGLALLTIALILAEVLGLVF